MSQIIDFYAGKDTNPDGHYLAQLLAADDVFLEATHTTIQWLFPLEVKSNYNPNAPLLTMSDRTEFAKNSYIRANVMKTFDRFLAFYGFKKQGDLIVLDDPIFEDRRKVWISYGNHNFLRITRIITSLRLMGFMKESEAFRLCVLNVANRYSKVINAETKKFWAQA